MSQKGLRQAGGVFRCPSGLSCFVFFICELKEWLHSGMVLILDFLVWCN